MNRLRILAPGLAIMVGLCAVGLAQDVKTDYAHGVNFSQFHTYYWQNVKTDDPLWEPRIENAVDQVLQSKGWQRVNSGGEVAVTAVGAVHNEREYQTFYDGLGGWRWGGFGETTTTAQNYPVGTLVVDMYDAQNHQLIWRGDSRDTLTNNTEKNEHKLDKDVDKMFKNFPPK